MERLTICVDFDGTLVSHAFPEIGKLYPHALEVIKWIKERGHDIILYTCREDYKRKYLTEAIDFLKSKGIVFDSVNENTPYWISRGFISRKPYWDWLIDDTAGFVPYKWLEVKKLILRLEKHRLAIKYDGNG